MYLLTKTDITLCARGISGEDAITEPMGVFDTESDARRYMLSCKACEGTYKARYAIRPIAYNLLVN